MANKTGFLVAYDRVLKTGRKLLCAVYVTNVATPEHALAAIERDMHAPHDPTLWGEGAKEAARIDLREPQPVEDLEGAARWIHANGSDDSELALLQP